MVSFAPNKVLESGKRVMEVRPHHEAKTTLFPPHPISVLNSLAAGGLAGAVAKSAIAPLDRVKILFQVAPDRVFNYSAAVRDAKLIIQEEGVSGLWRGNGAMMVRVVPYAAVQYMVYEQLKTVSLQHRIERMSAAEVDAHKGQVIHIKPLDRFVNGSIAGAVSVIVTYPLDLLRARFAVRRGRIEKPLSLLEMYRTILQTEGSAGLFRGMSATLLGIIPYAGLSFATFETMKINFMKLSGDDKLTTIERMVSGGIAGFVAQTATYPLDTVRRRQQVSRIPLGMKEAALQIYHKEGIIKGFYKGLSLNWIKGPIALAISFTTYDFLSYQVFKSSPSIPSSGFV
jgi:solute carrier family 25 protein 42